MAIKQNSKLQRNRFAITDTSDVSCAYHHFVEVLGARLAETTPKNPCKLAERNLRESFANLETLWKIPNLWANRTHNQRRIWVLEELQLVGFCLSGSANGLWLCSEFRIRQKEDPNTAYSTILRNEIKSNDHKGRQNSLYPFEPLLHCVHQLCELEDLGLSEAQVEVCATAVYRCHANGARQELWRERNLIWPRTWGWRISCALDTQNAWTFLHCC